MVIAASVANFKLLTFNYGWFKHPCLFVVTGFSFLYNPTLTSIHDYWKNHRKSPQLCTELLPPRLCLCAGTAASQKTGQSSRAPRALARAAATPPPPVAATSDDATEPTRRLRKGAWRLSRLLRHRGRDAPRDRVGPGSAEEARRRDRPGKCQWR